MQLKKHHMSAERFVKVAYLILVFPNFFFLKYCLDDTEIALIIVFILDNVNDDQKVHSVASLRYLPLISFYILWGLYFKTGTLFFSYTCNF